MLANGSMSANRAMKYSSQNLAIVVYIVPMELLNARLFRQEIRVADDN
jgi:hypothetical protein